MILPGRMNEPSVWDVIDAAPEDLKALLEFYAPELMIKHQFLHGWLKEIDRVKQEQAQQEVGEL